MPLETNAEWHAKATCDRCGRTLVADDCSRPAALQQLFDSGWWLGVDITLCPQHAPASFDETVIYPQLGSLLGAARNNTLLPPAEKCVSCSEPFTEKARRFHFYDDVKAGAFCRECYQVTADIRRENARGQE